MTDSAVSDNERLNKLIALELGVSRREADELIATGRVSVNDQPAVLGRRVHPDDQIVVSGTALVRGTKKRYLMLNKPVGYVCSRRAQGDIPTIYSLLPPEFHVLKPVGRLDKDSSGLILLSNDGDFAYQMTHPKFYKQKIYDVVLHTPLQPLHQQMIADYGVEIGDGTSKFSVEKSSDDRTHWRITMHEGRNRQIRRTFAALGYDVAQLHRISFGTFSLGDLAPGAFELTNIA